MSQFSDFLGSEAFTLIKSKQHFSWLDVMLFAVVKGDFNKLESRVKKQVLTQQNARKENKSPSDEAIENKVKEIRYQHNLLSADETKGWLEKRFLTTNDLYDYSESVLIQASFDRDLRDLESDILSQSILAVGFFESKFTELARELASSLTYVSLDDEVCESDMELISGFIDTHYPKMLSQDQLKEKLKFISSACRAHDKLKNDIQTDEKRLKKVVDQQGLSWMQIELANLAFKEMGMAKEALLQIIYDGQDLDSVSRETRIQKQSNIYFVDQLPERLQSQLGSIILSAQPGGMFGPIKSPDGYSLVQVVSKKAPKISNPDIKRRAEELALQSEIDKTVSQNVEWKSFSGGRKQEAAG